MLLLFWLSAVAAISIEAIALVLLLWRRKQRGKLRTAIVALLAAFEMPMLAFAGYLGWMWLGPQPPSEVIQIAQGVAYRRVVETEFRGRQTFHVVVIDLDFARPAWVSTPLIQLDDGRLGHKTQTAHAFAKQTGADVAINASFFGPADPGDRPLGFRLIPGAEVVPAWGTVMDGRFIDAPATEQARPINLYQANDNGPPRVVFGPLDTSADVAVSGGNDYVFGDQTWRFGDDEPRPRAAAGLNADGHLVLVVLDGQQPRYSHGMTEPEFAQWLRDYGLIKAVSLDGGGSAQLVARIDGELRTLNRPMQGTIPKLARPVANFIALDLPGP
ncbi:MAG: phosphodiester glycosidase family protein [Planctomycetota bacterium]